MPSPSRWPATMSGEGRYGARSRPSLAPLSWRWASGWRASGFSRLAVVLRQRRVRRTGLRLYLLRQPVDRSLGAAPAVRDAESAEAHFDHAQGAEDHRRVDMTHVGDADGFAGELTDPVPEHHAAFLVA